jgi:F420-dependent oxidoreductase-like protein
MRVCLMIEGQEGVTWDQWRALATTAEDAGFEALLRSDHYQSLGAGPNTGSLDAWSTLAALATLTTTLRLGTLVSPATFRHPAVLAREAVTVDHISGGRVEVGLGAGWHEREHASHGFPFDTTGERFDRYAEQLEIVRRSWDAEPFSFQGRFYRLDDADPQPKPVQRRLPLVAGGKALKRGAALAARWADEYNTIFATADECRERREAIAAACRELGREPITFSLMTTFALAGDHADRLLREHGLAEPPPGWVAGTPDQIAAQLRELEAAGVERVMLQHLLHDDVDTVAAIGREVIPAVS